MEIRKTQRPSVVLIAAILLFIFGGYYILGGFCSLAGSLFSSFFMELAGAQAAANPAMNPQLVLEKEVPGFVLVETTYAILVLLLGAAAVLVGILLLKMTPRARGLGMAIALASLLAALSHQLYSVIFVLPVSNRIFDQQAEMQKKQMNAMNPQGGAAQAQGMLDLFTGMMKGFIYGAVALGLVFSLASWLSIFFLLKSKSARDGFAARVAEESSPRLPEKASSSPYAGYEDDDGLPPPPLSSSETGIK